MVEVSLSRIVIDETSDEQVIVLKEKEGNRSFPIVIGIFEALAIKRIVDGRQISRPLTHELLISIMHSLGARLTRCLVSDLRDNTYYAILTLERNGQMHEIDARPSDAITLALHDRRRRRWARTLHRNWPSVARRDHTNRQPWLIDLETFLAPNRQGSRKIMSGKRRSSVSWTRAVT